MTPDDKVGLAALALLILALALVWAGVICFNPRAPREESAAPRL